MTLKYVPISKKQFNENLTILHVYTATLLHLVIKFRLLFQTLAASRAGHRPSDAMFLGAYASMFGNKLKSSRRTSMAPSIGSSSNVGNAPQVVELPSYRLEPIPKHVIRYCELVILPLSSTHQQGNPSIWQWRILQLTFF